MRSNKIIPVNAHHPNDRRWMLGTDSMKNKATMNVKTAPDLFSKPLSLIGY